MAKRTEKDTQKKKLNYSDLKKLFEIFLANDFDKLMEFINEHGLRAVDRNGNNIFLLCVDSNPLLYIPAKERRIELVESFLKSENMKIELVKKMIEQIEELNINVQNKYGVSALHLAVHDNNIELLELLLKNKNININIQDKSGVSALHFAVLYNNIELLELLLQNKNIKVDIQDIRGTTPLTIALGRKYDEDIIIKLLDAGADLNKIDNDGYRLYEFISKSMEKVKKYIKEHNIKMIK
jgi:ankyrin repeat protein